MIFLDTILFSLINNVGISTIFLIAFLVKNRLKTNRSDVDAEGGDKWIYFTLPLMGANVQQVGN